MKLKLFIAGGTFLLCLLVVSRISMTPNAISIDVVAPQQTDTYQLFYDIGRGFNETDSRSVPIQPSSKTVTVTFFISEVPFSQVQGFRINPGMRAGVIQIASITLRHEFLHLNRRFPLYQWTGENLLKNFTPLHHIRDFMLVEQGLTLTAIGKDPHFAFHGDWKAVHAVLAGKIFRIKLLLFALLTGVTMILVVFYQQIIRNSLARCSFLQGLNRRIFEKSDSVRSDDRISHKWIWLVALIFFAKACFLAFWITPLWDIPDEIGHFAYARDIFSGKGIPVLGQGVIETDILSHLRGQVVNVTRLNWIAQHPPAYYIPAGLLWKLATFVTDDLELLFRAPRIMSAIGGALTLVVLYHLLFVVSGSTLASLSFASCVGFIPMFSNLASGVNHDTTLTLFVSLATYFWTRFLLHGKLMRDAYYSAFWLSLSCFTKFTAFVISAPMLAIIFYEMDSPWKQRIRQALTLTTVWSVFPALWMSWSYYHHRMLLPVAGDILGKFRQAGHPLKHSLLQYLSTQPAVEHFFINFFGLFGWMGVGKGTVTWFQLTSFELMYYSIFAMLLSFLAGLYLSYTLLDNRQIAVESTSLADLLCRFSVFLTKTRAFGSIVIIAGMLVGFYASELIFIQHSLGYQFRSIFYGLLSFLAVLGCFLLLKKSLPKERIVAYAWIVTFFFIAIVIWQVFKSYLHHGQLRATHGRYLYPLIPLTMVGVFIPAISLLKKFAVHLFIVLVLALAYCELHIYLSQVLPFYIQGVMP